VIPSSQNVAEVIAENPLRVVDTYEGPTRRRGRPPKLRDEDGNVVKDDNVVNAAVTTTRVHNTRSKK
jgi:hypothetical protein